MKSLANKRIFNLRVLLFLSIVLLLVGSEQAPAALMQTGQNDLYLPFLRKPSTYTFSETFGGSPTSPTPWKSSLWDITVHSRDVTTQNNLESMSAAHGTDCSPHPAMHQVSLYQDAVFQCRDHMMTAINASGYGVIYLTPNHMVDFSTQEAVIRFDVSTARTSTRDWIDLWITPYEDQLQLPLASFYPDLSGEPRRGLHIEMQSFNGKTNFKIYRINNFQSTEIAAKTWVGYEEFLTSSATRRDTFELRISPTRIKFGMPSAISEQIA